MFREMRRKKQILTKDESIYILKKGTSGVLALLGDSDYPYAVPLSYVYHNSNIYFHCANSGHKIDAVRKCSKASFCVINQDKIVPEKYTTCYKSVIVFGEINIIKDSEEKRNAIKLLGKKYSPGSDEKSLTDEIRKEWSSLCTLKLSINHLTGKKSVELTKNNP